MPTFITRCRQCGKEYEPSRASIRAGSWRTCLACCTELPEPSHCRQCGRVLQELDAPTACAAWESQRHEPTGTARRHGPHAFIRSS
jgi:hypothetical protein